MCFTAGSEICSNCKSTWQADVKLGQLLTIPLYFTNYYNPSIAKVILAAKENGNQISKELLANSIVRSLRKAITDQNLSGQIALVSIPSSTAAIRKRGRDHIQELVKEIIGTAEIYNISIFYLPILSISKKIKDQSNLNKAQRISNMSGAYLATPPKIPIDNLIILDDLITTGASIQEGIRALSEIKLCPVAIITACAVGAHL